jgi:hypothetical protein
VNEITEPEDELAPVARSAPPLAPPKGMSARTKAETDRARLKLQLAQAALVGDQKAVKRAEEQRKRARQRESLTGRVEWTGIAARIRDEDK